CSSDLFYVSGPLIADQLGLTLYGSQFNRGEDDYIGGYAAKERKDLTAKLAWKLSSAQTLGVEASYSESDNERTARTGAAGEVQNERTYYALTHDWDWGKGVRTNSFITQEDVEIVNGQNLSEYAATFLNTKTVLPLDAHILSVGAEYKEEKTM